MPISLIHYMTEPYVTRMYLQMPKDQPAMKPARLVSETNPIDYTLVMETLTIFGGRRERPVRVSELSFLSKPSKLRYLNWTRTSSTQAATADAVGVPIRKQRQPKGFFVEPIVHGQATGSLFDRVYERVRQQSALRLGTTHASA